MLNFGVFSFTSSNSDFYLHLCASHFLKNLYDLCLLDLFFIHFCTFLLVDLVLTVFSFSVINVPICKV